jgi:phosphate transport system protein
MMTGTRDRFDRELVLLQGRILEMGSLVHAAVARGLQSLMEDNPDLAHEVIAADAAINRLRYEIEGECYHLLVTEQPVAGDMRAIVSGMIIVTELERIADHGKKIARTYLRMLDDLRMAPLGDIPRLGELALGLLDRALRSVANRDAAEAQAVCRADDQVDAMYKQAFNLTISYMLENPRLIASGAHLIGVAHELERIGDRATNVAERVIYAVTGELIELNL